MKTVWTNLFIDDDRWALGLSDGESTRVLEVALDGSGGASTATHARGVEAALEQIKSSGAKWGPLVVSLPSPWCFAATVSADGLARRSRAQGLIYRLEEALPIDAEQFTAGFIETGQDHLGVATRHDAVKPILDALENAGLTVAHVCPTALLVHEAWVKSKAASQDEDIASDRMLCVAFNDDTCDLLGSVAGQLQSWRTVAREPQLIEAEINALGDVDRTDSKIEALGLLPDECAAIDPPWSRKADPAWAASNDPRELAVAHTHALLRAGQAPALDLRSGHLAGRGVWPRVAWPANTALALAALLLITLGVFNLLRAGQAERLAQQQTEAQATLFRHTFPGQRVPAAVLSRFRSEAVKAKGLTGNDEAIPSPATTLKDLRDVLAGLPDPAGDRGEPAMRFRVLELRLDSQRFYLDGQVRSHTDADRLAAGLRESVSYTLESPRTQNLSGSRMTSSRASNTSADRSSSGARGTSGGVGMTLGGYREGVEP